MPVILCEYMCHKGPKKGNWGSNSISWQFQKKNVSPPEVIMVLSTSPCLYASSICSFHPLPNEPSICLFHSCSKSSSIFFLHSLKSIPPYEHFPGSHESSCRTIMSAKAWQAVVHLTMENSDGDKSMVLRVMVRLTERTAGTAITLSF